MHRLVVRVEAEADIEQAARWYEEELPGLGAEFLESVHDTVVAILESPLLYPAVEGDIRRAIMRRFPFMVYFTLDDDVVYLLAVLHGRRNPNSWRVRRET